MKSKRQRVVRLINKINAPKRKPRTKKRKSELQKLKEALWNLIE